MRIKLSDENYTGAFGGVWFENSEAEVDAVTPRLERACMVTGKTLAEVVVKSTRKPRKRVAKKK